MKQRKFYVKSGDLKCTLTAQNSFWAAVKAFDEHLFEGCCVDPYFIYVNQHGFDEIESVENEDSDWWQTDGILESLEYPFEDEDPSWLDEEGIDG